MREITALVPVLALCGTILPAVLGFYQRIKPGIVRHHTPRPGGVAGILLLGHGTMMKDRAGKVHPQQPSNPPSPGARASGPLWVFDEQQRDYNPYTGLHSQPGRANSRQKIMLMLTGYKSAILNSPPKAGQRPALRTRPFECSMNKQWDYKPYTEMASTGRSILLRGRPCWHI